MPLDAESLYRQLGQLVAEAPLDLAGPGPVSGDTHRWLGRIAALLEEAEGEFDVIRSADRIGFNSAADGLGGADLLRKTRAHQILAILHRALARAELNAPASTQGAFIPVGAEFTALQAIGKVLTEARKELLIVDAYMDATLVSDFAPLAPEGVPVWLLTDGASAKLGSLRPIVQRWTKQYGIQRPLETRTTPPRELHDRLIIVDGGERVWSLTQSFNHLAARSPASLLRVDRVDREVANAKRDYYYAKWNTATPL